MNLWEEETVHEILNYSSDLVFNLSHKISVNSALLITTSVNLTKYLQYALN